MHDSSYSSEPAADNSQPAAAAEVPAEDEFSVTVPDDRPPARAAASGDDTIISMKAPLANAEQVLVGGPQHFGQALEGQQLAHFRLERFIGGGGMGVVFRAFDTQLERTVAVKVLTHRYGTDDDTVRRFHVEAQSAARLNHENIARVYFVGEDKGWNFIVFEFIAGENLRDIVTGRGPLSIDKTIEYAAQLADALEHASLRDVVHRDIKPSNVLIAPEGRAKLVDMGLARLHQVETGEDDLTASGVTLGTFDYISPEQGRDPRHADVRSDLYSLGCTLYYTLTGRPPFPDGTVLQKLLSHTSDAPPNPNLLRPETPPELAAIVSKLLAKLPEHRYQRPVELIADLATLAEQLEIRVTLGPTAWTTSPPAAPPAMWRHLPWVLPVLLLIAAVLSLEWIVPTADLPDVHTAIFRVPRPSSNLTAGDMAAAPVPRQPRDGSGKSARAAATEPRTVDFPDVQPVTSPLATENPPEPDYDAGAPDTQASGFFDAAAPPVIPQLPSNVWPSGTNASEEVAPTPAAPGTTPQNGATQQATDKVQVLFVGSPQQIPPAALEQESWRIVSSLDKALRMASDLPNLRRIDILDSGPHPLRPTKLVNLDLTIRGVEGTWPVVTPHSPAWSEAGGATTDAGNQDAATLPLLTIVGGRVRFENTHFETYLGVQSDQPISLLAIAAAELVALSQCWITMAALDPAHPPSAAVFDIAESSVRQRVLDEFDEFARPPVQIDLRDCVLRGDIHVVRIPAARPVRFTWVNGFLATTGRLISLGGGSSPPRDGEQITIDLDHLTAVVDNGLCHVAVSSLREYLYTVDINCTRSILASPLTVPMVEYVGREHGLRELDAHLFFSGQHNFYEGNEVFWRKYVSASAAVAAPLEEILRFEDWQMRWDTAESRARRNQVVWKRTPDASIARHAQTPHDFLLDPAPNNPARQAAGGLQRHDAGFRLNELPKPPSSMPPSSGPT